MKDALARTYRMLVTDIDGTLVDHQQQISKENMEKIRAFQEQGGIVTIATGRMEKAAFRFVSDLGIKHPVILYNGAKIVDFERNVCALELLLPTAIVEQALELMKQQSLNMIFYAEGKLWVSQMNPTIETYMKKDGVVCQVWENEAFLLKTSITKVLIIAEDKNFHVVYDRLANNPNCELVNSEETYLEILPPRASKGAALKLLAAQLGIPIEEVIAIGDHLNDLDMLVEAGLGVAVENAHPELKKVAGYIAPSHLEHAIADVIDKYCLSR